MHWRETLAQLTLPLTTHLHFHCDILWMLNEANYHLQMMLRTLANTTTTLSWVVAVTECERSGRVVGGSVHLFAKVKAHHPQSELPWCGIWLCAYTYIFIYRYDYQHIAYLHICISNVHNETKGRLIEQQTNKLCIKSRISENLNGILW